MAEPPRGRGAAAVVTRRQTRAGTGGGDLYIVEVESGAVRQLTATAQPEEDPQFSPMAHPSVIVPGTNCTCCPSKEAGPDGKLEAIVRLYLAPPEQAIVLCVDEKSQVQALDRSQPSMPMKPGRAGRMTHDYKRHGNTTLFAALNSASGKVISLCHQRHRHQERIKFLRLIDVATPPGKVLHLIVDNYSADKHPKVGHWLEKAPRFHIHYTPTSSSWLKMVERFFRGLTENRLRCGVFRSVLELIHALEEYVDQHNASPKSFIWAAQANDILAKVIRAKSSTLNLQSV